MIIVKSEREIELMRRAGKITAAARALAGEMVKPGVTTREIDKAVFHFIRSQGAEPSFLNYNGYPASVCVSVNDEIIHGIPVPGAQGGRYRQCGRGRIHRRLPRRLRSHLPLRKNFRRGTAVDRRDSSELF